MAWSNVDLVHAVLKLRDANAGYGQTADAVPPAKAVKQRLALAFSACQPCEPALLGYAARAERIVQLSADLFPFIITTRLAARTFSP